MHIMLTNDDGIGAKGIMALYRAAVERGHEVTMCAPRYQQSAASHRFTLAEPIYVSEYPLEGEGCKGFSIAGTPADCVRVGMSQLVDHPVDILISGINDGYNAGIAVHYSGTVGAAMEGSFHHIPAIATSIHHKATQEMFDHLARYTIELAEKYAKSKHVPCSILNINAPLAAPEEVKAPVYAPLDGGYFVDSYIKYATPRAGDCYWLSHDDSGVDSITPGSDVDYLEKGHIPLTIMGNFMSADKAFWATLHIG